MILNNKLFFLFSLLGILTYFVASLLDMSDWGGTDTESLKKEIDSIFFKDGKIHVKKYETKLVSLTADGASVNTGRISSLMTRFALERDWLLKIHCINHRVKLAIKDALKETKFKEINNFFQSNFNLLTNSGKIKSELRIASEAQRIQHYTLPKISGTRFIGHRPRAFKTLLYVWPSFIMAYENVISNEKTQSETRAKVIGLLKKFKNYNYITLSCSYLDIFFTAIWLFHDQLSNFVPFSRGQPYQPDVNHCVLTSSARGSPGTW